MKLLNPVADCWAPKGRYKYKGVWFSVYRLRGDTWLPVACDNLAELKKLQMAAASRRKRAPPLETKRKGLILYIRPKKADNRPKKADK